ncbi:MAG: adenylate/guanylate cyclase domain-containing protein, partial [Nitrospinales bacterium]
MNCPKCSTEIPPNFKFCGFCGEKLDEAPPEGTTLPETGGEAPSPDSKNISETKPHRTNRDERREVAVLFADVSGFTTMSEKLDPEEVHSIMNEVFEILGQAIHEEDGYIDKYIGDNVMALFGAPIAHEDDAERACRAALAMQQALKDFSVQCEQETGFTLRMRVGINCGLVFAGNIGSDFRRDYSVMGDTVNLASRMESKAPLDGILVTEEVVKRVRGKFEFDAFQSLQIKGKDKQVRACVLLREITDAV